ncbi:hypothetical protein [Mycolicibacterium sp. CR10]|uniref:hypothetical protein n=1 Tax=Mycolicibacterium sp. CR10 TaxID=2562314 RepID=UPI0010BF7D51|nr:hypothetical protein [Mycolicibacterium sp. CR10]
MTARETALAVTAVAVLLTGCGGGGDSGAGGAGAMPSMSDAQAPPQRLVIDVAIQDGRVTPTNAALSAAVGEPIVLRVDSDRPDELHVHSTPEHRFDVVAGPGQSFQFTVDMPGRVDVELHELNKTVATIQVR